jgi:hypothetical protein
LEPEFGEFSGETGGEAGAFGALEMIGAEVGRKGRRVGAANIRW